MLLGIEVGTTDCKAGLFDTADVCDCRMEVLALPDATLLGEALLAGLGHSICTSLEAAVAAASHPAEVVQPWLRQHLAYRRLFEGAFLALQEPIGELGSHSALEAAAQ
jgi:sugar (pentulose or hexulose) kinase